MAYCTATRLELQRRIAHLEKHLIELRQADASEMVLRDMERRLQEAQDAAIFHGDCCD